VIPGQTGLLVKPSDIAGLRDSILQLLQDSTFRLKLGEMGQRFVAEHFSAEAMASRYFSLYQMLVANRHLAA
jgi:glycosyltransferase involved in cell wall biosynthesis